MWKEKYDNKCVLLHNDDEILASLENSSCREIFMHADPRDPIIVAVMSRGSPRSREKLKWWHIVEHDKTPNHLIEAEGFKIVQVEGDPHKFSTLQVGMIKTDQPSLDHSNGVLYENLTPNGHTFSNHNASYPEEKKKSKEEIDGDTLQKLLEEQKKTNQMLGEIKISTTKTAENTKESAETGKDILRVQEEALVGITEASV